VPENAEPFSVVFHEINIFSHAEVCTLLSVLNDFLSMFLPNGKRKLVYRHPNIYSVSLQQLNI